MPEKTILKIFIASSAELKGEREKCILILNKINKNYKHLVLEPVEWEYNVVQGNFPNHENIQAGINPELTDCPIAIFLFHSRIGKFTREEFELAMEKKKKLFVYFKEGYTPNKNTVSSFSELLDFKESLNEKVLYKEYKDLTQFELLISDNLNLFLSKTYSQYIPGEDVTTLSRSNLELIQLLVEKEKEIKEVRQNNTELPNNDIKILIQKLITEKQEIKNELSKSEEIKNQLAKDKQALELQLTTQKENDGLKAKALEEVEKGNYAAAESYLKQSAKDSIDSTAATFYELGKIKSMQLQFIEAYDYYELSAKVNPESSDFQNQAGIAAYNLGHYDEAIEYYKKTVDIFSQYPEEYLSDTAIIYNNIGVAYYSKADYGKAIKYYKKALQINTQCYGKYSPEVAYCYSNLGLVLNNEGEYDKAIEYHEKSFKINIAYYGENSQEVATDYNNLGAAYHNLGEYNKAVGYHEKALKINLPFYDGTSPDIAVDYNNLAAAYNSNGEHDKAIEFYNKALKIDIKYYGNEHPSVATRYNNLGLVYNNKKEHYKAIEYHNKALKIDLKYYGEHPDIGTDYNNLGVTYYNIDMYERAIENYELSLLEFKKFFQANHPNIQNTEQNIQLAKKARQGF